MDTSDKATSNAIPSPECRVLRVNHGDCMGIGKNWYTFYCPHCQCQVYRNGSEVLATCNCGGNLEWNPIDYCEPVVSLNQDTSE